MAVALLSVFAALALALAAIGVYGVLSYAVSTRTQEIGIRMALGAARHDVVGMVVSQVLRLVASGVGIGLLLAALLGRALRTLLFGVSPTDPVTLIAVSAALTVVALMAGYLPARRASRINPVQALRYE
jgi:ABC-type antimicrobial peptide transport system permease subunit